MNTKRVRNIVALGIAGLAAIYLSTIGYLNFRNSDVYDSDMADGSTEYHIFRSSNILTPWNMNVNVFERRVGPNGEVSDELRKRRNSVDLEEYRDGPPDGFHDGKVDSIYISQHYYSGLLLPVEKLFERSYRDMGSDKQMFHKADKELALEVLIGKIIFGKDFLGH